MPYEKTTWINGAAPGISAEKLNKLETQYDEAIAYILANVLQLIGGTLTGKLTANGGIDVLGGLLNGITLEGGKHVITNNDGGGNFVIRVGNKYNEMTEDGFGGVIIFDQTVGNWIFKMTTASQTTGQVPTWVTGLIIKYDGTITWMGNKIFHEGNDGVGSGLDADKLQGATPATTASANSIAKRDASGYIFATLFNMSYSTNNTSIAHFITKNASDGYMRPSTIADVKAALEALGLNATTLDNYDSSSFQLTSTATKFATGTYTGNGTTSRFITVGFTPKFVKLWPASGAGGGETLIIPSTSGGYYLYSGGASGERTYLSGDLSPYYGKLTTNGFYTSDNGSLIYGNRNGETYLWEAIG